MVADQRHSRDGGWPATGSGPGAITPDGCSVELYSMLPAGDEPRIVHDAAGEDASILELGAGAGRVTHPLLALGHPVVAVDESPEMLARIHGAELVQSRIEELDLGREFDAVLLASHLVNIPDVPWRRSLLATCRRHLAPGGRVLIQRHPPEWFDTAEPFERRADDLPAGQLVVRLRDLERPGPGLLSATVVYQLGERTWSQSFTAARVDDGQLAADLGAVGLEIDRRLTRDGSWVSARRTGD
jgi:SAM-dependent methyltransferase